MLMEKEIALVFSYHQHHRYSFNSLAGALETAGIFSLVKLYFIPREEEMVSALSSVLNAHEKVVVGISFFSTQILEVNTLMKILQEHFGQRPLYIAGGPHPTGDPLGTLNMGFDIVVRGEGEETLIELLKRISSGEDYRTVKGIAFINDDGNYYVTGIRSPHRLDRYPPFAVTYKKVGPVEITRGCSFRCAFCQTPYLFGREVRHRSIENICHIVEVMKGRNLSVIRFITPSAFSYGSEDGKAVNVTVLGELLSALKKIISSHGRIFLGSFPSEVRPEHVTRDTVNLVLKYADNDNLVIGAQSGSQRILDSCHRGHTVSDIYHAVELTIASGLKANVDFIFGLPGEQEEDVQQTVGVINDLVKRGARIHAHTFMPLPQTPFARSPAGKIPREIKKMLRGLLHKGAVFGDWMKQERIARTMEDIQ